ncbi:MAG: diacylglycerol kinase [Deltaproteobacteria bacterium]|nr:diacylglycerol kinase [Candidatus Anaeroferrophillacea bacterium]
MTGEKPAKIRGWRHLLAATGYSLAGLRAAWATETSFRFELLAAAVGLPVLLAAPVLGSLKAGVAGAHLLLLVIELLNTAIEYLADMLVPDTYSREIKRIKDVGSAAVFVGSINLALHWTVVLYGWLGPA